MIACSRGLNQPQPLQTRVPVLADDDVVVHGNTERHGDLDDCPGATVYGTDARE